MTITYREIGNMGMSSGRIQVLIAGSRVGDIHPVLNGYRYFPKGSNVGGETFTTVAEVKHSLGAA
jgi:hypothetical protein